MEFFCDVSRLDGVLIDDPVVTAAIDDEPIAMLLVDTPALGTLTVVVAGTLARDCADRLERRDHLICTGVLHHTTLMATELIHDRQHTPRTLRHQRFSPEGRQR
jgi:hypothetical protein